MFYSSRTYLPPILLLLLLLTSCMKDLDDVTWDTTVLTPLAKTSLSIESLVQGDSSVKIQSDKSLSIIYREKIYSFTSPLDTLVNFQIDPLIKDVTLQSLELGSQNINQAFTLQELFATNFFLSLIPDQVWLPIDNPTPISIPLSPMDIDISNVLQTAVLTDGTLSTSIDNQLPVNILNIDLEIKNTVGQEVLYSKNFQNINSGQSINDVIDLAAALGGQPIEGKLTLEMSNVQFIFPNVDSVFIDYSDYITAGISLTNLKVSSAKAIFPAQNLVEAKDTIGLRGMGDIEIKRATIKTGAVTATVRSTVEEEMEMEYYIPSATLNGDIFSFIANVPAAPPGGTYEFDERFPYDGYDFDFTGKDGTLTNTFYNELFARIDSTGKIVSLSLDDTLSMEIKVVEMTPSYVEGYLGQQSINIPADTVDIDVFGAIKSGSIAFESASLKVTVENGLGIDGQLNFNSLKALNTSTGQEVTFPVIPPFQITEAQNLGSTFESSISSTSIANAETILNILPNKIFYNISGDLNPGGNTPAYQDFVYEDSELNAFLDLEIPLSVSTDKLVLTDTAIFSDELITAPEEYKGGILRFIVNNSFPMTASFNAYFLSPDGVRLDSLISPLPIASATAVNDANSTATETILEFPVGHDKLANILHTKEIIFELELNTPPGFTKIYSTYSFDIQLTAEFDYNVKSGL